MTDRLAQDPPNEQMAGVKERSESSARVAFRSPQQRLIALGFLVAIATLVFLFSAAYRSNSRFVTWNNLTIHTRDVLRALDDFSSAVKSAQLAAVDFYTSGNEADVTAFSRAVSQGHTALAHVQKLTVDNVKQQHNIETLSPLADQAFALLGQVIQLHRDGKSGTDALKPVNEEARKITPSLVAALTAMTKEENGLLESRSLEAANSARRTRRLQLIGGIFATALVLCVFVLFLRELSIRFTAESRLKHANAQLRSANRELEAFSYSVSHDLRAPLRGIDGFSQALLEDHAAQLDDQGRIYLQRVRTAVQRMGTLIDDLINLSRIARTEMTRESVDLSKVARGVADELRSTQRDRNVEFLITPGLQATGDTRLMRIMLQNLLNNSYKFTSKRPDAKIEFGRTDENGHSAFFVKDNGAGFDPAFSDRLFGAFQRLHSVSEFPGTGIGLATVQRIVHLHGGNVWAKSEEGRGATFFFTL